MTNEPPFAGLPADLVALGATCGRLLADRDETVAVGEGSAGGLMSAALLAAPGASGWYRGGSVVYTMAAFRGLLDGQVTPPERLQGASEPWALHLARSMAVQLDATWGIGEGGAAGPTGNRYGDPAGHAWVAVAGPVEQARRVGTDDNRREANMIAFAAAGLELLIEQLRS
ncbi:MAG: CinA family protein [Acidimicrobiales bacterium]